VMSVVRHSSSYRR